MKQYPLWWWYELLYASDQGECPLVNAILFNRSNLPEDVARIDKRMRSLILRIDKLEMSGEWSEALEMKHERASLKLVDENSEMKKALKAHIALMEGDVDDKG